jgi:hypothetical protein
LFVMKLESVTPVTYTVNAGWNVTPRNVADIHRNIRGTCCLLLQGR